MAATHLETYHRYLFSSALSRDAEAVSALFTDDGVLESPLVTVDGDYPQRMVGRREIRAGLAAFYRKPPAEDLVVDTEKSAYTVHDTVDPDVFIVEIDTAVTRDGVPTTISLVQIFRLRDGLIASMRDYFAPDIVA